MTDIAGQHGEALALSMRQVGFAWSGSAAFKLDIEFFDVAAGERTMLLGPSGGGKSTLLSLICGIVAPNSGNLSVLGLDMATASGPRRDRHRADHLGVMFQQFNLLPYATALENVLLPLRFSPRKREKLSRNGSSSGRALELLAALGIEGDNARTKRASSLSVGQQQRVAAARALLGEPELVVADEPTSSLDRAAQGKFLDLLFEQVQRVGATLLLVSHDESLADRFQRVVRLEELLRPSSNESGAVASRSSNSSNSSDSSDSSKSSSGPTSEAA